jgi:hypothetical protein
MFVLKSKYEELVELNKNLVERNEVLAKQLYQMEHLQNERDYGEVRKAGYAVDLDSMNAFSVERSINEGRPKTIIGHVKPDGSIGEWMLDCSADTHRSLVQQFKDIIVERKKAEKDLQS